MRPRTTREPEVRIQPLFTPDELAILEIELRQRGWGGNPGTAIVMAWAATGGGWQYNPHVGHLWRPVDRYGDYDPMGWRAGINNGG